MAEAAQDAGSEFWRAPAAEAVQDASAAPALPEVCDTCSSEFIVGAAFCHVCGARRSSEPLLIRSNVWARCLEFASHLQFHSVKERVGLPTPALVAFLVGIGCLTAAILVGVIFSANTVLDWQAVQVWRIQWLLGSAAAFLAGILLKRN